MAIRFSSETFDKDVLGSSIPVLVDFYADWCGPCKMMTPIVDKLAEEFEGRVKIGKFNVEDDMYLAREFGVSSIPDFVFIRNGEVVDTVIGKTSLDELREKLEAML